MAYRKQVRVEWMAVGSCRRYFVRPGSRSRPWIWFKDGAVPDFDEDSAWFIIEKRAGQWVAVERAEGLSDR